MTETTTPTPEEMRDMADALERDHDAVYENARLSASMLRSAASALDAQGETTDIAPL